MPFGFDSYQSLQQAGLSDPAAQTIADLFQQVGFTGAPAERLTQLYQQARGMAQAQQGGQPQTPAPASAAQGNPLADAMAAMGGAPSMGGDGPMRSVDPSQAGYGFGGLSGTGAKRGMQIGSLLGMGAMGPVGMLAPALMGGILGGVGRRAQSPGLTGGFMNQVGGGQRSGYTGGFASQVDTGGVQSGFNRGGGGGGFSGGRDGGYSGGFGAAADTGGVR